MATAANAWCRPGRRATSSSAALIRVRHAVLNLGLQRKGLSRLPLYEAGHDKPAAPATAGRPSERPRLGRSTTIASPPTAGAHHHEETCIPQVERISAARNRRPAGDTQKKSPSHLRADIRFDYHVRPFRRTIPTNPFPPKIAKRSILYEHQGFCRPIDANTPRPAKRSTRARPRSSPMLNASCLLLRPHFAVLLPRYMAPSNWSRQHDQTPETPRLFWDEPGSKDRQEQGAPPIGFGKMRATGLPISLVFGPRFRIRLGVWLGLGWLMGKVGLEPST